MGCQSSHGGPVGGGGMVGDSSVFPASPKFGDHLAKQDLATLADLVVRSNGAWAG